MAELQKLADRYDLLIVEDAAPAIGATLHGRKAGSFVLAGCISLNPMKLLSACGETGAEGLSSDKQEQGFNARKAALLEFCCRGRHMRDSLQCLL